MADGHDGVVAILDRLRDCAADGSDVSVGAMRDAMGARGYGPFLLVPALLEISPVGGIPGVPTVLAAIILLFAVQMLWGRTEFWLPALIADRSVSADRLGKATNRLRGIGRRLDRWFHGRLPALTRGIWIKLAAAACMLLALTVPPLEFLPFASTVPMAAIAMFGLALLVKDGLLMLFAMLLSVLAVAAGSFTLLG